MLRCCVEGHPTRRWRTHRAASTPPHSAVGAVRSDSAGPSPRRCASGALQEGTPAPHPAQIRPFRRSTPLGNVSLTDTLLSPKVKMQPGRHNLSLKRTLQFRSQERLVATHTNRLADETSPYLLQHAHN